MGGVFKAEGTVSKVPCAEAYVGRARESLEARVDAQELRECGDDVREVTHVSIIALRTGWDLKRSSSI